MLYNCREKRLAQPAALQGKPKGVQQMKKYSFKWLAIIAIIALLFASCDLFNSPTRPDFMAHIDREIAWANAPRLSVTLAFPGTWGSGSITTLPENRRLGFDFELEFTPNPGFGIAQWRAYRTSDLEGLNWLGVANPAAVLNAANLTPVEWGPGAYVELMSEERASGGEFTVRVNTTEPLTLIPFSSNDPMIQRTFPFMNNDVQHLGTYRPNQPIIIYLTAPVDPATIRGGVQIRLLNGAASLMGGSDITEWFDIVWNSALWRIAMIPRDEGTNLASMAENTIEFTFLSGESAVRNEMGGRLLEVRDGPVSFSWHTDVVSNVEIMSLGASYNGGEIQLNWTLSEPASARIQFSVNGGLLQTLYPDDAVGARTGFNITIRNVGSLNTGGVRSGQAVSNIQHYDIRIQIEEADGTFTTMPETVQIWNFPGMEMSLTSPVTQIINAEGLRNIQANSTGQYVTSNA